MKLRYNEPKGIDQKVCCIEGYFKVKPLVRTKNSVRYIEHCCCIEVGYIEVRCIEVRYIEVRYIDVRL